MINKRSTYIGAAIFLVFIVFLGSWFFWISPNRDDTATLKSDTEALELKNDILAREVEKLKIDFEKLPEYRSELAQYRVAIPTEAQISEALTEVATLAETHSVQILSIGGNDAEQIPGNLVIPSPEPSATSSSNAVEDPAATPSPSASATPQATTVTSSESTFDGFHQIQQNYQVIGSYDNVTAFLADLQSTTNRYFYVAYIQINAQEQTPVSDRRPATNRGDVQVNFAACLFVLDKTADADKFPDPAITPTPEPTEVPPASPGKNPWQLNADTN